MDTRQETRTQPWFWLLTSGVVSALAGAVALMAGYSTLDRAELGAAFSDAASRDAGLGGQSLDVATPIAVYLGWGLIGVGAVLAVAAVVISVAVAQTRR